MLSKGVRRMKIVNLGPDEPYSLSDLEEDGFELVVYEYEAHREDYYGEGFAVGVTEDTVYSGSLGHCSCFGPFDSCLGSWKSGKETFEEFLTNKDSIHDISYPEKMYDIVKEYILKKREEANATD
jgi:hypothetical protein